MNPANELERLLAAASQDPAARPKFYQAVLEADLLIVGRMAPDGGAHLQSVTIDGAPALVIFSSMERLQAVAPEGAPYLGLKGRDLFEMVRGARVVLNYGAPAAKEFIPAEIEAMLDGSIFSPEPLRVPAGSQMMLGQPARVPEVLLEALRKHFAAGADVADAWLAQVAMPETGLQPHCAIGVRRTAEARPFDALVPEMGAIAVAAAEPVVFVEVTGADGLDRYFLEETQPFYRR